MSEKIKKPVNKDSLIIMIVVLVIVLITAGILCYYFFFANNEVVATYDGGTITKGEFELYYRTFAPVLSYYGYPYDVAVDYIAEKAMLDEILYKKASDEGYKITDEEIAEVEEEFTDETMLQQYASYGVDLDGLKELFFSDVIINRYIQDQQKATTAEQVKAYIDEIEGDNANYNIYNTRHILVTANSSNTAEEVEAARVKAQGYLKRALAGEDFVALVQESDSSLSGDDAGVVKATTGNVVEEYINAVLTMQEGKVHATLVKSQYGFHIIKLEEIEENGRLSGSDDVEAYVNEMLSEMQAAAEIKPKDGMYTLAKNIGLELGLVTEEDLNNQEDDGEDSGDENTVTPEG